MDRHNNHLQADRIQALLENAVSTGEVAGVNLLVQKDGKDLFYGQAGRVRLGRLARLVFLQQSVK